MENAILALRNEHPSWGARKLKARLEVLQPRVIWPAASTLGNTLSRAGLTNPKHKKRRTTPYSEPFSAVTAPNQLWCMDFKGCFSTGDRSVRSLSAGLQITNDLTKESTTKSRQICINAALSCCRAHSQEVCLSKRLPDPARECERRYKLAKGSGPYQPGVLVRGSWL